MKRLGAFLALLAATCLFTATRVGAGTSAKVSDQFIADLIAQVRDGDPGADDDSEDEEAEDPCDSPDSSVVTLLVCLRSGTWQERLTAVEWLPVALGDLGEDSEADAKTVDESIDLLIQILHDEPDDWITRTLLDDLEYEDGPGINRLFRAALEEVSVNLQGKAVDRLILEEDPDSIEALERLWGTVVPTWLRRSLILAIANQELEEPALSRHLEEFIDLTVDPDPEIRPAAIEALGVLAEPAAAPAILRAARHGAAADREMALETLQYMPTTEEVIAVLRDAVTSGDGAMCDAAMRALPNIDDPDAEPLMLEVLRRCRGGEALSAAVQAFEDSDHPDATLAIAGLLTRIDPALNEGLTSDVLRALHNRDDVEAVGLLSHLSPGTFGSLGKKLSGLVDYLSRDRSKTKGSLITTSRCGVSPAPLGPSSLRARHIAPTPPFETVRCWEAPSVAGHSWDYNRINSGMLVQIVDYFERPGESWVQVDAPRIDCWVPLANLDPADTPPPAPDPTRKPRVEFDLEAGDARSAPVRRLLEAGVLEILESEGDDDVVAAALSIDPADPDQVALLQAVAPKDRGALDRAIARLRRAWSEPLP
ncbi:MAG TPA: HEAT repeat domain-containing protein [Candidatus Polarisedimenticolia bacterium]|nr:HEAT repeat domain-containing protein [Candidatus Polarisedimenticolia bacterium]